MSIKKHNASNAVITILLCLIMVCILCYSLSLFRHAGPKVYEFAQIASEKLSENITDISFITYDMLEEYFKQRTSYEEFNRMKSKKVPDKELLDYFERISSVPQTPDIVQESVEFSSGTASEPIEGIVKIKGIKYKVSHRITYSIEHFSFNIKVIKWDTRVERLAR